MPTIRRNMVLAAIKEAGLDYGARLIEGEPALRGSFGIRAADVGEVAAFMFALGAVVERSSTVNEYLARMAFTCRRIQLDDEDVLTFPGWELEV